ncbi:vWA domain-containing protein [uncultured Thiodictyon sp.]|uniref:vWA domain-containing protein n=1 Tax=uncultured Thiodictyon sp. TaxID=1846217 RepID=UPI0025FED1DD|nr:vWA domain-containing protein [uncultured Thiodictyon sp.]
MHPRFIASAFIVSLLALLLVPLAGSAAPTETPLLQPGKKALYERVLTRPGARVGTTPGEVGDRRLVAAFSQFYVYERRQAGNQAWLRVGGDTKGSILGWIAEPETVPWKQQLILVLTNPAVRDRLVFFDSRASLEQVLRSPRPTEITQPLIRSIAQGGRDSRVVALEPENYVDIRERFYLLPVLDHVQTTLASGDSVRLLRIASVTEPDAGRPPPPGPGTPLTGPEPTPQERPYRAAVVFVIDSTLSMGPYIEQTKQAVTQVLRRLREAGVIDRVRFGLVAFRAETDDATQNRQLDYVARTFVDPTQVSDDQAFLASVQSLREARTATSYFDEDAFAGVTAALDKTPWQGFDARFVVLITDAGALDGSVMDGGRRVESKSGLDAARLASLAGEKQVAITVFHLKTAAGTADHRRAEDQYRELARNARFQTEAYLPINGGSAADFRRAVDALTTTIVANVGETTANPAPTSQAKPRPAAPSPAAGADETERHIREIANALGHAMRLRYLGNRTETRAPTVFDAWISDRDFADPSKQTVEVRVLLTKNQLSDLQMILQRIVNAADNGMLKPDQFFDTLRSIAAQFGRDPSLATSTNAKKLADLGLLDEYLEGLPYQSQVMALSQDIWTRWGPEKQVEFTNDLKRKLRQYARYNEDWEGWVNPAQTPGTTGDIVYPVPLDDMP